MKFRDLLDPERALAFAMKLALCLILLSVVLQFVCCALRYISPATELGMLCIFFLVSPLAYFIREWRRGAKHPRAAKRGAERTPLLPQHEEVE